MAKKSAGSRMDRLVALLDGLEEPGSGGGGIEGGDDVITISARPPRIEIKPRSDIASAPPSENTLKKWQAGVRAASNDSPNVVQIFDVIGYDWWTGGGITAKSISDQLAAFNGADCEVQINSPGGDMFEGIAIYNVLQQYKGKITVKIMALAASAASIIAMAGDVRQIGEGAFYMIHNAWVVAIGNRHDMQEVADYLEPFDFALRDIYARVTKQKTAKVQQWMDDETFLGAEQAIELGFATALMTKDKMKEDTAATTKAAQFNSVRRVESLLTKEGGMSRSQARAVLQQIKVGKPDAAAQEHDIKPGADVEAMHDAGTAAVIDGLRALIKRI